MRTVESVTWPIPSGGWGGGDLKVPGQMRGCTTPQRTMRKIQELEKWMKKTFLTEGKLRKKTFLRDGKIQNKSDIRFYVEREGKTNILHCENKTARRKRRTASPDKLGRRLLS